MTCSSLQVAVNAKRNEQSIFPSKNYKYIHMEKSPSNKTPVLTKIMNTDDWVVGTSNLPCMMF